MRIRHTFAALFLAFAVASPAGATSFREMTTDERVDAADLIVRGTVQEVWVERDERGALWTRSQVEVERVYKGDPSTETIIVDQLGGELAGVRMVMEGSARFSPGEEVVLMLANRGQGRLVPVSMAFGKFTIRLDPYTQAEIVQQTLSPHHLPYDHRFLPLPEAKNRQPVAELERLISRRVEASR